MKEEEIYLTEADDRALASNAYRFSALDIHYRNDGTAIAVSVMRQ